MTMRDVARYARQETGPRRDEIIAGHWATRPRSWLPEYHPSVPGAFDAFLARVHEMIADIDREPMVDR